MTHAALAFDVTRIREDFPILSTTVRGVPLVFLDSGASAQKPRQVIAAMTRFLETSYANVHRGAYHLSEAATEAFENARAAAARFLNAASPREILFTANATAAFNLLAHSFGPSCKAVVVSEMDSALMKELQASKTPCVFYDVGKPQERMTNIRVNYRRGIERLVEYLHDLGHCRFAFVGHHSTLGPTSERETAFLASVKKFAPAVEWRTEADRDGFEGGRMAALRILAGGFAPTAFICVNDIMAVGVLRALREKGLRVPEDVSVTGFDNIRLAEFCEPPLTTVHIPRDEIGRLAFAALIPDKEMPNVSGQEIILEPEVVLRASTSKAKR